MLDEHGAGWLVNPESTFENLQVEVVYRYAKDNVVVWDNIVGWDKRSAVPPEENSRW